MAASEYHEAIWSAVPEGAVPAGLSARRAFLLSRIAPGERVLDLGCGTGELTEALRAAEAEALGVDVSEQALRRAAERHPQIELRLAPADGPLPLGDAQFDVVWAGEVIEHVRDSAAWMSEVRRVLRPGGRLLLTTPYHGRLSLALLALSPGGPRAHFDPRGDHLRFYTPGSLRVLLADLGFEEIDVAGAGGLPLLRRSITASAARGRW
jgi:2-polyprenyl-6-hydroxyphenyl methylase/3-demethylubiquinone-9 3-methyltransferase